MKKTLKWIAVLVILLVLLFPHKSVYEDGGTKTYTALSYKVIVWNTLEGKTGTEIHLFPKNFHDLDYYLD